MTCKKPRLPYRGSKQLPEYKGLEPTSDGTAGRQLGAEVGVGIPLKVVSVCREPRFEQLVVMVQTRRNPQGRMKKPWGEAPSQGFGRCTHAPRSV